MASIRQKMANFSSRAKNEFAGKSPGYLQVRLVGRNLRHIESWSVFKVSLIFYLCVWVVSLIVGALLWGIASSANLIQRLENFMTDLLALESYDLPFSTVYFVYSAGGLALALIATTGTVLMCVLLNQISAIFGGVRVLVMEEETVRSAESSVDNAAPIQRDKRRDISQKT